MSTLDDLLDHEKRLRRLETQEIGIASGIGGYAFIEEKAPSGADNLSFTSIPTIYRHLRIMWMAKSVNTNEEDTLRVRFNGDTGSNYRYTNHQVAGPTSAIHTIGHDGLISGANMAQITGDHASLSTAEFATGVLNIPYYIDSNQFKTFHSVSGNFVVSRAGMRLSLHIGYWENADAINAIDIDIISNTNFEDESKFALYGLA